MHPRECHFLVFCRHLNIVEPDIQESRHQRTFSKYLIKQQQLLDDEELWEKIVFRALKFINQNASPVAILSGRLDGGLWVYRLGVGRLTVGRPKISGFRVQRPGVSRPGIAGLRICRLVGWLVDRSILGLVFGFVFRFVVGLVVGFVIRLVAGLVVRLIVRFVVRFVIGIFSFALIIDLGSVTISVSGIGDGLESAVRQVDEVRPGGDSAVTFLRVAKVVVRRLVAHDVVEVIGHTLTVIVGRFRRGIRRLGIFIGWVRWLAIL